LALALNRVFIGYDIRQPVAYTVCQHSIITNSSKPVSITPLMIKQLPVKRMGCMEFSFSRYLVPYLCDFKGKALFLDQDMVVTGDVTELFELHFEKPRIQDWLCSVYMMTDQPDFEQNSVMLFNNEKCKGLSLEYLQSDYLVDPAFPDVRFNEWADGVGELPKEWNHCVGYHEPSILTKLYHYTQGLPLHIGAPTPEEEKPFWDVYEQILHTESWELLMGGSQHVDAVKRRLQETSNEAA